MTPAVRRCLRYGGGALLGLLLIAGTWLAVTAWEANHELTAIRNDINLIKPYASAGDMVGLREDAADLANRAHRAHVLTTGPAWAVAAAVPYFGTPIDTVRQITDGLDTLAGGAVPPLINLSEVLDPATIHRGDTVDIAPIKNAAPAVHGVAVLAGAVNRRMQSLPSHTWLEPVNAGRDEFVTKLDELTSTVQSLDKAAGVLPAMLGEQRAQRYFIGFQNEAEARGLGGLPGSFAIIVADHGKISIETVQSDSALDGVDSGIDLGPDYNGRYGDQGEKIYLNSTISPNFPWVAQIWAAMWQKKTGERLDGALTLDPTALSYMLSATGPATLPDGTVVGAGNVVDLTQSEVYQQFGDDLDGRRQYLIQIAAAVQEKILSTGGDGAGLIKAGYTAVHERRLLAWSADPTIEATLAQTAIGGALPTGDAPFTGVTVVNAGANKLDYYLDRTITYARTGCGSTRDITVTITLRNNAPAFGLSDYVTQRLDNPSYPTKPGDNKLIVNLYASKGATLVGLHSDQSESDQSDAASLGVATSSEVGHPVFTTVLELPRGEQRTLTFRLREPAHRGKVQVLQQPMVRPLQLTVSDTSCA